MTFWKAGHANTESARIRMCAGVVKFANKLHQIDGVLKRITGLVVRHPLRPISAESENVPDSRFRITKQNTFDFLVVMTDAGQVGDRIELGGVLNPFY